jgi:hypothetical protein
MPDPTAYSRATRARVALSLACQELSNSARGFVPTSSDGYARGGDVIDAALSIASQAQQVLELAVIVERERATSWEVLGESLGVTKQAAHERFARPVERWRAGLVEPWAPSGTLLSLQLPAGAEDPAKWARRLDEWVLRHREPTDVDQGEHPVSGRLPEASLVEQISTALAEVRALQEREHDGSATPSQRRAWYKRKAELFERLAAAEPGSPAYAEAAANARRQEAEAAAAMSPREAREHGWPTTDAELRVLGDQFAAESAEAVERANAEDRTLWPETDGNHNEEHRA